MRSEVQSVLREVEKVIVGKTAVIGKILLVLLAEGHALLDDVPGVGKTTLAVALGRAVDCAAAGSSSHRTCCLRISRAFPPWTGRPARCATAPAS